MTWEVVPLPRAKSLFANAVPTEAEYHVLQTGHCFVRGNEHCVVKAQEDFMTLRHYTVTIRVRESTLHDLQSDKRIVKVGLCPNYDVDIYRDIDADVQRLRQASQRFGSENRKAAEFKKLLGKHQQTYTNVFYAKIAALVAKGWKLHPRHGIARPAILSDRERTERSVLAQQIARARNIARQTHEQAKLDIARRRYTIHLLPGIDACRVLLRHKYLWLKRFAELESRHGNVLLIPDNQQEILELDKLEQIARIMGQTKPGQQTASQDRLD